MLHTMSYNSRASQRRRCCDSIAPMEKSLGEGNFGMVMSIRRNETFEHPHRALLWLADSEPIYADFKRDGDP